MKTILLGRPNNNFIINVDNVCMVRSPKVMRNDKKCIMC
jgi:hypothetical protein